MQKASVLFPCFRKSSNMADEVVRLVRRVSDIGLKPGFRFHLKVRPQGFKSTRRLSAFSVGLLLKNTLNENRNGLGSEQEPPAAVQRDSQTSAGPVFFRPSVVARKAFCGKVTVFRRSVSKHDWVFIRTYSGNQEPLYRTKTAYYEILGISASATQAQIKTAYYKQSFAYHPDRNANSDDATLRFSEINEAYTVLGNKALRKKYDNGLLSSSDLTASAKPSVRDTRPATATKRQTDTRRSMMGQGRSAEMFDFDKFYKAHYGEQLQREKNFRERRELQKKKKKENLVEQRLDRSMELGLGLMVCVFLWIVASLKKD